MDDMRPFSSPNLGRRIAPFGAVVALAFLLAPLPPQAVGALPIAAAGLCALSLALAAIAIPWRKLPRWAEVLPLFLYLPVVALLRHAEGGAVSGLGTLGLLPTLWFALYGSRSHLIAAVAILPPFFLAPMLLVGGSAYPATELERAVITTAVAALVGFTAHGLVNQVRSRAARLHEETQLDELTGALNGRGWAVVLGDALEAARATGRPVCIAVIDMDHLKFINDTYGHQAGNGVLQHAVQAWRAALRKQDRLARYGGDEFGVVLPDSTLDDGRAIADRLRRMAPPGTSCSIGVALWDGSEDAEHLMGRADTALYDAKRTGRARVATALTASPELATRMPVLTFQQHG